MSPCQLHNNLVVYHSFLSPTMTSQGPFRIDNPTLHSLFIFSPLSDFTWYKTISYHPGLSIFLTKSLTASIISFTHNHNHIHIHNHTFHQHPSPTTLSPQSHSQTPSRHHVPPPPLPLRLRRRHHRAQGVQHLPHQRTLSRPSTHRHRHYQRAV